MGTENRRKVHPSPLGAGEEPPFEIIIPEDVVPQGTIRFPWMNVPKAVAAASGRQQAIRQDGEVAPTDVVPALSRTAEDVIPPDAFQDQGTGRFEATTPPYGAWEGPHRVPATLEMLDDDDDLGFGTFDDVHHETSIRHSVYSGLVSLLLIAVLMGLVIGGYIVFQQDLASLLGLQESSGVAQQGTEEQHQSVPVGIAPGEAQAKEALHAIAEEVLSSLQELPTRPTEAPGVRTAAATGARTLMESLRERLAREQEAIARVEADLATERRLQETASTTQETIASQTASAATELTPPQVDPLQEALARAGAGAAALPSILEERRQSFTEDLARANQRVEQAEYDQALEQYRGLADLPFLELSQQAEVVYRMGRVHHLLGRLEKAEQAYSGAMKLYPAHQRARTNLAVIRYEHGVLAEAEELLKEVVAADAELVAAWHNLGLVLSRQDRAEDALVAFGRAAKLRPGWPEPHWQRGETLLVADDPEGAEQAVETGLALEAAKEAHERARGLHLMGRIRRAKGDPSRAIEVLAEAAALDPKNPALLNDLGLAYLEAERTPEALRTYRRILEDDPSQVSAWNNKGLVLLALDQPLLAQQAFIEALGLQPRNTEVRFNLGLSLEHQQRYTDAVDTYDRLLKLAPGHVAAMNQLGILYRIAREEEEALRLFQEALDHDPSFAQARYNEALVLLDLNRTEEARASLFAYLGEAAPDAPERARAEELLEQLRPPR